MTVHDVFARQFSALAVVLLSLWSSASWADSMLAPSPNPKTLSHAGVAPLLSAHALGSERFYAVGSVKSTIGLRLWCTATLIASSESPDPGQAALILTAGHCTDVSGPTGDNEVVIDKPLGDGWSFTPAFFFDNTSDHHQVPIKRVVYSSMKSTDIALLELDATYGELRSRGIKPLILENFKVADNSIEAVHIPIGLFPGGFYLRHSVCQTLSPQPVFEGIQPIREDSPWFWPEALPSDCMGVYGGSSGSPIFAKGGTRVIGILFTAVDSGFNGCGWGRPCEVTEDGVNSRPEAVYFNSVYPILAALRADNTLDLSKLDPGTGVGLERAGSWSSRAEIKDEDGVLQPARWRLKIDETFEQIRYKTGPASSTRCEQPKGYGEPIEASAQPLLNLQVNPKEGIKVVCVIGKRVDQSTWQPMSQATIKLREIDNTAPLNTPDIFVDDQNPEKWYVQPLLTPNENVRAYFKYGPLASTDCTSTDGYSLYTGASAELSTDQQWRYCSYAEDAAGNPSRRVGKDIGK